LSDETLPAAPEVLAVVVPPSGFDGFLGTRASLGMDVLLVGLLATLPVLAASIAAVRSRRYAIHKSLQLVIVAVLVAAIVAFEIDIRLFSDWRLRAAASPFWPAGVLWSLGIHLVFAVSTLGLWTWVVWEALRRFPRPPVPGSHGPRHRRMARLAALDLIATAVTGVIFYWLAFVS
jgi:putative membrane protein